MCLCFLLEVIAYETQIREVKKLLRRFVTVCFCITVCLFSFKKWIWDATRRTPSTKGSRVLTVVDSLDECGIELSFISRLWDHSC